uniref:metallophosphoesterase n=1 Tax=Cryobacterium sp. TaxID=1926290 RepID=UPI0015EEE493|nr:metallophosphoesterase [Cryobacterium sp.]
MPAPPSRRTTILVITAAVLTVGVGVGATSLLATLAPTGQPSSVAEKPEAPIETPPTRIAIAGDTGTGTPAQFATAEQMRLQSKHDPYDGLLLLGDLIYDTGDAALVEERITTPFAPITSTGARLLPALGNHDYQDGEQNQILEALNRDKSWYAEMVGSVKVIVLDSNQVENNEQRQWLRKVLSQPTPAGTWTIVAMHHPAYSAGAHGSDLVVRETWSPLFAEFEVPLVLAGHDHDYQRSLPQDGVTYIVSGGGATLRPTGEEDFTAVSISTLHYLDLHADDKKLVGRAIDPEGATIDTFTINR